MHQAGHAKELDLLHPFGDKCLDDAAAAADADNHHHNSSTSSHPTTPHHQRHRQHYQSAKPQVDSSRGGETEPAAATAQQRLAGNTGSDSGPAAAAPPLQHSSVGTTGVVADESIASVLGSPQPSTLSLRDWSPVPHLPASAAAALLPSGTSPSSSSSPSRQQRLPSPALLFKRASASPAAQPPPSTTAAMGGPEGPRHPEQPAAAAAAAGTATANALQAAAARGNASRELRANPRLAVMPELRAVAAAPGLSSCLETWGDAGAAAGDVAAKSHNGRDQVAEIGGGRGGDTNNKPLAEQRVLGTAHSGRAGSGSTGPPTPASSTADPSCGSSAPPPAPTCEVIYEIQILAVIPGCGRLSGKPVLSEAARKLPAFDLGAFAVLNKRLRPRKHRRGLRGWWQRRLSLNVMAPFRGFKGLLRCVGLRG